MIDTVRKRASAAGLYWPGSTVDRIASIEEYSGIGAGKAAVPSPLGVPELIGPTMRTPGHVLTIGREDSGLSLGSRKDGLSISRGGDKHTIGRHGGDYTTSRRGRK